MEYIFRIAKPADQPILEEFLYLALQDSHGVVSNAEEVEPMLNRYLEDWGQPGDLGFIIDSIDDERPVAAAWFRQFSKEKPGYGFISEDIPEVTVAVLPEYRRSGLGRDLLLRLINQARLEGFSALSLPFAKANPAKKFYDRLAFLPVREEEGIQILQRQLK